MSADNAVYIRQMPDGIFRIRCIHSLYGEDRMSDEELDDLFKEDPRAEMLEASTEDEAWEAVDIIEDIYDESGRYIEYLPSILPRLKPING